MKHRLLLVTAILTTLSLYTAFAGARLFKQRSKSKSALLTATLFAVLLGSPIAYRTWAQSIDSIWLLTLSWLGAAALGLWSTFILISLVLDFSYLLRLSWPKPVLSLERRQFLSSRLALTALQASSAMASFGFLEAIHGPKMIEVSVPIDHLPAEFDGFKIAQISDLHVGPTIRSGYVQNVVDQVNAAQPDLIAVTGDLADGLPEYLTDHLAPLAQLKSQHGIFYVTGNHEYYWDALSWISKTQQLGMITLINQNRVITHRGRSLLISGITDPAGVEALGIGHTPNPKAALQTDSLTDLKILLAHRPEACELPGAQEFDVQLSGHTHAGQFFPFSLIVAMAHRYNRGLYRKGKSWIYVNRGTGYWGAANRFLLSSEITLLQFKTSA